MACGSGLRPMRSKSVFNGLLLPSVRNGWSLHEDIKNGHSSFQTIKEKKYITVSCPSYNSQNFSSDSHSLCVCFQECNCSRSTSASQRVFHLSSLSHTNIWLKYVAKCSNRNRLQSSKILMCTSLERATRTPNIFRQGHVFENLTHMLQKLCHSPLQMSQH